MVTKHQALRVAELEKWIGVEKVPDPTLFVVTCDTATPDPQQLAAGIPVLLNDETTIGLKSSMGSTRVVRLPGETIKALRGRAVRLVPDVRVWITLYAEERVQCQ